MNRLSQSDPHAKTSLTTSVSLLQRVADGEPEAWRRFVDIYSAMIYSRCRRSGLQQESAADIIQNVFVSVHRSLHKYHSDGKPEGFRRWLRTVTRNAVLDHFRKENRQHGAAVGGSDVVQLLQNTPDPFSDEDSLLLTRDSSGIAVHRVLSAIRDDYEDRTWQAFWQTAVEDKRPVDVANDLGLKPGTVRQARYKILARIREELEGLI
ncbi:MAG: sigma-70 family RNA polymerase sigma factor [Planctomycetaceae bacterium]|nr:sigma-70 family RNA polymerase sigma factor [Planctomycetaceae bacterium]